MIPELLVAFALLVGLVLLGLGLREPLIARLGLRNALRHRRQTLVVVLGLLTGTAVVTASLVAGDSLEAGLYTAAISSLGETDLILRIPGNLYIPSDVVAAVAAPPHPDRVDAVSAVVLESAAIEDTRTLLYEPGTAVIGFDPVEDRAFGAFTDRDTGARVYGDDLGPDDVYLNDVLATTLDAAVGDTVQLTFREPLIPVVPRITWKNGTLASAAAVPDGVGGWTYTHSPADDYRTSFAVPLGAEGILAAVAWPDPANATDLDIELVGPGGLVHRADNGTAGPSAGLLPLPLPPPDEVPSTGPINPAVLFVPREGMATGAWEMRIHGKNAENQPFFSFVAVLLPEYDLGRALAFFESLGEAFGDEVAEELGPDLAARSQPHTANFTVLRIVAMEGKAVFFDADVVFLRRDAAQDLYGVEDRTNWIKVTHRGDAEGGLAGTAETRRFFVDRLASIAALGGAPEDSPAHYVQVVALKAEFVSATREAASIFTQFLTLIGSFTLIAGVMLIINIFSMLAEERRHELGIARAVGLTRGRLVLSFAFEGSLYTLVASALGVLVGMALAGLLVAGINRLAPPEALFSVPYEAAPASLALAFAIGALLTFATVAAASFRASRLNIVRAIRDLDEPDASERRLLPSVVVLGAVVGASALAAAFGSYLGVVLGPALSALAAGPLLSRGLGRRLGWIAAALMAIAWTLATYVLLPAPDTLERDLATVARGVLLVIAATIVLVEFDAGPRAVSWLLSRSRRLAPLAVVAMTYPLHRRFRTGLTLSMYALVLLVIVVFSTFFTMFTPDITRETGGYDVVADSQVPTDDLDGVPGIAALAGTPDDPFLGVERVDVLVDHFEFGDERILVDGKPLGGFGGGSARFIGFDPAFAEAHGFALDEWDPAYGTSEREVWRRVAADSTLVIVSFSLPANLTEPDGKSFESGATLTLNGTGGGRDFIVAGIMEQTYFGGVWMARAEVERLFADIESMYLFRLDDGEDPYAAAARIERAFRPIGMDADAFAEDAAQVQQQSTRIYQLFQAYLGLGLIVGVASIGIVTSRAVLERRREIGMLKAIGFTRGMVAAAFLIEVVFILLVASLIGVGMGLAIAWAIFVGQLSVFPGMVFAVPWGRIGAMLGLALFATLAATLVPAYRASRVPAAEALRALE